MNSDPADLRDTAVASAEGAPAEASGDRAGRAPRRRTERIGERQGGGDRPGEGLEEAQADAGVGLDSRVGGLPVATIGAAVNDASDRDRTGGDSEDQAGLQDADTPSGDLALLDPERRGRSRRRRGRRDRGDEQVADAASAQGVPGVADARPGPEDSGNAQDLAPMPIAATQDQVIVPAAGPATRQPGPTDDLFPHPSDPGIAVIDQAARTLPAPAATAPSQRAREDVREGPREEAPAGAGAGAQDEFTRPATAGPMVQAPFPPAAAPAAVAQEAPDPQPARPQATEMAAAPLRTEELTSVVASAGLEWVQTTHGAAEPADDDVAPAAARPRRQRKPKEPIVAEPLQQVETQPGDAADL